jgi:hypothetical protein
MHRISRATDRGPLSICGLFPRPGVRSKYPITRIVNPVGAEIVLARASEKFPYCYQDHAHPGQVGEKLSKSCVVMQTM